jgi:hypothetical protein
MLGSLQVYCSLWYSVEMNFLACFNFVNVCSCQVHVPLLHGCCSDTVVTLSLAAVRDVALAGLSEVPWPKFHFSGGWWSRLSSWLNLSPCLNDCLVYSPHFRADPSYSWCFWGGWNPLWYNPNSHQTWADISRIWRVLTVVYNTVTGFMDFICCLEF